MKRLLDVGEQASLIAGAEAAQVPDERLLLNGMWTERKLGVRIFPSGE
jgi:hypothetical protein